MMNLVKAALPLLASQKALISIFRAGSYLLTSIYHLIRVGGAPLLRPQTASRRKIYENSSDLLS